MIIEYLKLIIKDIKNKKFSSFLTFFAISIGILSIFSIILISEGFSNSIEEQFNSVGQNRLIITPTQNVQDEFNDNLLQQVKSKTYVSDSFGVYLKNVQLEYNNEYQLNSIYGVDYNSDIFSDFNYEIEIGRFPKSQDKYGVLVTKEFASSIFDKELKLGSNIYINDTKFKVIGILKNKDNSGSMDKTIYANIDTIRNIYNSNTELSTIYAEVVDNYDVILARDNLDLFLKNKLGEKNYNIQTMQELLDRFNNILDIVKITLGGIAFVSLIVGAIGIINTMFVVVTEKTKEIGIYKAIGAKNSDIFFLYSLYSGMFGLFGSILGIIFGTLLSYGFSFVANSLGFSILIKLQVLPILGLIVFGFIIGVFAGFLPAYRASKLKIVDTFRK